MSRIAHPLSLRRRSARLLALGLLAVALHVLAGTGLMMRPGALVGKGDAFAADVCTSHGVASPGQVQASGSGSQPATAMHDCCKLCAAGAPLLVAAVEIAVPPAPTFNSGSNSQGATPPRPAVWTAHSPRGPPARA